jgi:nucleoid DNA-binding protein
MQTPFSGEMGRVKPVGAILATIRHRRKDDKMALPKLTQSELADSIADEVGCSRAEAKRFLEAAFKVAADTIAQSCRLEIAGVIIAPALKAATKKRMGRNPQTGEVEVAAKPASTRVALKASRKLKEHLPTPRQIKAKL